MPEFGLPQNGYMASRWHIIMPGRTQTLCGIVLSGGIANGDEWVYADALPEDEVLCGRCRKMQPVPQRKRGVIVADPKCGYISSPVAIDRPIVWGKEVMLDG